MAGCSTSNGGSVEGPVTVYVSLPLTGPRAADGRDAADGARLALEQADDRAGDLEVQTEFLDDAEGKPWDPVVVAANARTATEDSSAAAYIGELDSQPTRTSAPITNEAGMVQISPGSGAVDLTRPAEGYPDSPGRYQPSGEAGFARVVPADDEQARALAQWASELGGRTLSAVSDGSAYGDLMVAEFTTAAEASGLQVPPEAAAVDLAFSASDERGLQLTEPGVTYETSEAVDPSNLPDKQFASEFEARFDRRPGAYAAYGYEAMQLALDAIADASDSGDQFRDSVRDGVLGAERSESLLGPYSITSDGDSTVCMVQRYRIQGPERIPLEAPCPTN